MKILLSFDTEEFDVPKEHGVDFTLEQGMEVSKVGTNRILDVLKENGVKATFFCTGNFARLAPEVIAQKARIYKGVSANVDFYSGFVYSMLEIPLEMYTPIFAIARIVGWSAHRIEELINMDKIIRPAYLSVMNERNYVPLEARGEE